MVFKIAYISLAGSLRLDEFTAGLRRSLLVDRCLAEENMDGIPNATANAEHITLSGRIIAVFSAH